MDYIHSKNVIHNNIQPENLFLRGSEVFIGGKPLSIHISLRNNFKNVECWVLSSQKKKKLVLFLDSDFDEAAIDGSNRSLGYSNMFASTGFYENRHQYPMDDLESLVFSIWYIASVPLGITNETVKQPEGQVFMKVKKAGKARERVLVSRDYYFAAKRLQKLIQIIWIFSFHRKNVNISKIQRFRRHSRLFL